MLGGVVAAPCRSRQHLRPNCSCRPVCDSACTSGFHQRTLFQIASSLHLILSSAIHVSKYDCSFSHYLNAWWPPIGRGIFVTLLIVYYILFPCSGEPFSGRLRRFGRGLTICLQQLPFSFRPGCCEACTAGYCGTSSDPLWYLAILTLMLSRLLTSIVVCMA